MFVFNGMLFTVNFIFLSVNPIKKKKKDNNNLSD